MSTRRGSVTGAAIVGLFVAVVVVVVVVLPSEPAEDRPSVRYIAVDALTRRAPVRRA